MLIKRAGGKVLDQPEEAIVLGAHRGLLWYRVDSQKGEAATLEGATRPWCWVASDVEDLELKADSPNIPPTIRPLVISTRLGCMEHFRGGLLRTVYPDGAIVRDGLEIDCSDEIGRLEIGTVVYASERRVNSCDIARFLIEYELPVSQGSGTVQGWVSERIRGGDEALIMEKVRPDDPSCLYVADGNETPSSLAGAAASKRATADDDAKEDKACDEEEGSCDPIQAIVRRWARRLKRAAQWALAEDTKSAAEAPHCAASIATATLDAWLEPSSIPEGRAETTRYGEFSAFHDLAKRYNPPHTGSESPTSIIWDTEADMQLAEVLHEWCNFFGVSDFHNLPFRNLHAMLLRAATATAAASSTVDKVEGRALRGMSELCETDAKLYSALSKRPKLKFVQAASTQPQGKSTSNGNGMLPSESSVDQLLARAAVLCVFNNRMRSALPFLCLSLPEEEWEETSGPGSSVPIKAPPLVESKTSFAQYSTTWQPLCAARRLRLLRRLLLTSTKEKFWDSMLTATTTPTALHHDEYEDSREIRTIKINRVRATPQRLASARTNAERLRCSVFGQLHREMKSMTPAVFRRAYLGKGHGGQRRAFKVKFLGEGVDDYGGPYRAVFDQVVEELQGDALAIERAVAGHGANASAESLSGNVAPGRCILPVLIPTPNRANSVGTNQDRFLFAPGPASSLQLDLANFLGKMIGMGMRHGLKMGLDLPGVVWYPLVGQELSLGHLEQVDAMASRLLRHVAGHAAGKPNVDSLNVATSVVQGDGMDSWLDELTFITYLSDGTQVPLMPNGARTLLQDPEAPQGSSSPQTYIHSVALTRLRESLPMLQFLFTGMSSVLPTELLPLFTPTEIERLVCGVRNVDVNLLKQCTEYEDVEPDAPHVVAFWEVLEEFQPEERAQFLKFVWARSRLPISASDFPMNFKLQGAQGGAKESPDSWLPHAQTCFFSLALPAYSSKEVLREKLLFAIKNSPNMDADVRLHEAEGWSGLG